MRSNPARRAWAAVLVLGALTSNSQTKSAGAASSPWTKSAVAASSSAKVGASPTPSKLELVPIDDSVDPLVDALVLPQGAIVDAEGVPVGHGDLRTVHYVRVDEDAEDDAAPGSLDRLRSWLGDQDIDADRKWLVGAVFQPDGARQLSHAGWRSYLGSSAPVITGDDVADAQVGEDAVTGTQHVEMRLTADATERFRAFTRTHTGRRLAIVIDGRVESAPLVREEIEGGRIQVVLLGDPRAQRLEARRLAAALRAGARN